MDQQDKKPTDPTPKAPGDPTSKKPDDQNQKPPTLEEEIRSFEKRAEAFLNNRGAQELVVESKELVSRTFTALQEKTQELEKEKEDHARNVRVLNEQIAIVHKEARESAEKEGIAQKSEHHLYTRSPVFYIQDPNNPEILYRNRFHQRHPMSRYRNQLDPSLRFH